MTWPASQNRLSDAERTLLATLSELPRVHPIVSMFSFDRAPQAPRLSLAPPAARSTGRLELGDSSPGC
jgi:hypothetical protein